MEKKKGKARSGFTLLELLIVMVIIGLLIGLVAPRFTSKLGQSKVRTTQAQIEMLGSSLETYYLDTGSYPTTQQGLTALLAAPMGEEEKWNGPYLKKLEIPKDGWDNEFEYYGPDSSQAKDLNLDYVIISRGKDEKEGGEGEDADLFSYK